MHQTNLEIKNVIIKILSCPLEVFKYICHDLYPTLIRLENEFKIIEKPIYIQDIILN